DTLKGFPLTDGIIDWLLPHFGQIGSSRFLNCLSTFIDDVMIYDKFRFNTTIPILQRKYNS
ncbi:hypothetical protein BpHYR1_010008, partial [Brachionus plicatilis]